MTAVGNYVQAGESLALTGKQPLWFELWENGQALNPEEVIAF
jgi:septal ring factor EnvC (AmiA/AmiB activator)